MGKQIKDDPRRPRRVVDVSEIVALSRAHFLVRRYQPPITRRVETLPDYGTDMEVREWYYHSNIDRLKAYFQLDRHITPLPLVVMYHCIFKATLIYI